MIEDVSIMVHPICKHEVFKKTKLNEIQRIWGFASEKIRFASVFRMRLRVKLGSVERCDDEIVFFFLFFRGNK